MQPYMMPGSQGVQASSEAPLPMPKQEMGPPPGYGPGEGHMPGMIAGAGVVGNSPPPGYGPGQGADPGGIQAENMRATPAPSGPVAGLSPAWSGLANQVGSAAAQQSLNNSYGQAVNQLAPSSNPSFYGR